ncbi:MAG: DUF460 domain-containing protein [Candidatus Aenigmarchaeota archaeon]|nr:DUF460 domain-containing protein [Candidatus Aenigmarchaeota archaeon]
MKNIIVGYDTGLNVGVAIFDTEGKILFFKTFRGEDKDKIIHEIFKFGRPIIFATDRSRTSKSVKIIASSIGCKILRPKRDLLREEKEEIVKNLGIKVDDDHQRDAVAAGYFAYSRIRRKIELIRKYLRERNLLEFFDEVVYRFFKRSDINLAIILEAIREGEKTTSQEIIKKVEIKPEKKLPIDEILLLKKRIFELERELEYYKKMRMIFSELIDYKDRYLRIEKYFEILKKMHELEKNEILPVINVDVIDVYEFDQYIGMKNLLVFSNDEKKCRILSSYGVKALLTEMDLGIETGFPILKVDKNKLMSISSEVFGINKKDFEKVLRKMTKEELKKWVEEEKIRH